MLLHVFYMIARRDHEQNTSYVQEWLHRSTPFKLIRSGSKQEKHSLSAGCLLLSRSFVAVRG